MKLTAKINKYLNNKLRGGEVNERGNRYENYFATFRILELINNSPTLTKSIYISSQEKAFVDDLLIKVDQERELYQLKSSKKLKWGFGKKIKTLNFDFSIQRGIENFHKRNFKLFLTVSNESLRNDLNVSLPKHLKKCTRIILFPYYDSIQKQIENDSKFKDELIKLSALNSPTTDKLESLAATILGAWNSSNKKMIQLEDLYTKIENIGYSFIKARVINNIAADTKSVLDSIPDFKYIISNNYLTWEYKKDSGFIPYQIGSNEFNIIEEKIKIENPKNFITLEKILY